MYMAVTPRYYYSMASVVVGTICMVEAKFDNHPLETQFIAL